MPGQVAEVLPADGVQRPEHHDLAVLPALHHGLEPGAQRQRRLPRPGATSHRHDPDRRVEQQVDGDALLGAAPVQPEDVGVAADQAHLLVRRDPAERAAAVAVQHQAGVAGQVAGGVEVQEPLVVEHGHLLGGDVELGEAGPAGLDREAGGVLLRHQPDGRGLDPHRDVLGQQDDVEPVGGEVGRDREDAGVVVAASQPGRQAGDVGVVELDPQRAPARRADRQRDVEAAVLQAQVVEVAQGLPGEVPQLRVVALVLQLGHHHDGQDHLVLGEAEHRVRVGQQDGGVEHVRGAGGGASLAAVVAHGRSPARARSAPWSCPVEVPVRPRVEAGPGLPRSGDRSMAGPPGSAVPTP